MKYVLTIFVILVIPAADAFSFLLDLFSYPHLVSNHSLGFILPCLNELAFAMAVLFCCYSYGSVDFTKATHFYEDLESGCEV